MFRDFIFIIKEIVFTICRNIRYIYGERKGVEISFSNTGTLINHRTIEKHAVHEWARYFINTQCYVASYVLAHLKLEQMNQITEKILSTFIILAVLLHRIEFELNPFNSSLLIITITGNIIVIFQSNIFHFGIIMATTI